MALQRQHGEEHVLDLAEEEQLEIALALSAEEARGPSGADTAEDERLARQLQEAEYAQAQQQQQQQQPMQGAGSWPQAAPVPPGGTTPPEPPLSSGSSGGGRPRLVDSLRAASAGAVQRIGSGTQQLLSGVRRLVDPPQQPQYAPPPVWHGAPAPQQSYTPPVPAQQQPQQVGQPPQQGQLSDDEKLALALQRQVDLEEAEQAQHQAQQQARQQARQQPQPPPQHRPPATGPLGANLPPVAAAAAGWPGPSAAPPPQRPPRPAAAPAPPSAAAPRPGLMSSSRCAGCGGALASLFGPSRYITALGRHWHPGCLLCASCGGPIADAGGVRFVERQGRLYHPACHKREFHPRCDVCGDFVPEQADRRIVWTERPYWKQRYCPHHEEAEPRCSACDRLQPHAEQWVELEDGRPLCLACLDTVVTDTRDAQPLWQNVLAYFAGMGMALPVVPPMMLVDGAALNDAEGRETHGRGRGGGPVFHVRGLTLTEEYRDLRTILRLPGGNPFSVRRETVQVGGTRHHVTAILVLFGLPRLLTGSILAHETTHAWLRMSGFAAHRHLRPQVEEGLCQLIALLWLEAQQAAGFKDAYEERLAAYLGHCIRTDQSEVYGEGFRMAHEAFQQHGLAAVLAAVRQTGELPPTAP